MARYHCEVVDQKQETRNKKPETRAQRGIALVVTLIMLSVITFMAVTFLVLSHRETNAVTTTTSQTTARFAAETGTQRAIAEILARIIANTNDQDFDLMVSTNFINPYGFIPNNASLTNVNYDYRSTGGNLNFDDLAQNIANLFYNPRVPVFVDTNRPNKVAGPPDFRFYLDLNENGRYETNGFLPVYSADPARPYINANTGATMSTPLAGLTESNYFVGDPEWIGVLDHPDRPHAADNRFVSRFAYLVVPAGKTLDINAIHNDASLGNNAAPGSQSYRRNMGVGSWEINLAAFLADLNTNEWNSPQNGNVYNYQPFINANGSATGFAFDDANAFLNYRYGSINGFQAWRNLLSLQEIFGPNLVVIRNDIIDESGGGGPLNSYMTGPQLPFRDGDLATRVVKGSGWAGADNPVHFFSPSELFDPAKTGIGIQAGFPTFVNRLVDAGGRVSSYDRYTFYRLLAQLGTDSAPEQDKMNLNYDNLDAGGHARPDWGTNMVVWNTTKFFTNAAQRMFEQLDLREIVDTNRSISVTNIPVYMPITNTGSATNVYIKNYYTAAVHRLLQLSANLYDATTNRPSQASPPYPAYPTVFRPFFRSLPNGVVVIVGYREVVGTSLVDNPPPMYDLNDMTPAQRQSLIPQYGTKIRNDTLEPMVYGIPLIIGAKKGYPNFNEFSMQTEFVVTRKLEFRRPAGGDPNQTSVVETNQMYVVGISNVFGLEAWNSYSNAFPRPLNMLVNADISVTVSNDFPGGGQSIIFTNRFFAGTNMTIGANNWLGFINEQRRFQPSLRIPLTNNAPFLSDSTWRPGNSGSNQFVPKTGTFDRDQGFPVPHWWLTVGARVRFRLTEGTGPQGHIVDYVNLAYNENTLDVTSILQAESGAINCTSFDNTGAGNPWCTNRFGGFNQNINSPTYGIINQFIRNESGIDPSQAGITKYVFDTSTGGTWQAAVQSFANQFMPPGVISLTGGNQPFSKANVFYTPFNPCTPIYIHTSWQANDPLVHYTIGDLILNPHGTNVDYTSRNPPLENIGRLNSRYEPWDTHNRWAPTTSTKTDLGVKDPLVRKSDDWDFPTFKLPNVGWIGRVHRGTPWQTVYLKAPDATNSWFYWTQNDTEMSNAGGTNFLDTLLMRPVADRGLFDLFTATLNDNASRGQLSINQTNLAAWSAVLSGVLVMSNFNNALTNDAPAFNVVWINPAGIYNSTQLPLPPVAAIVAGINRTRSNTNGSTGPIFADQSFHQLGDILAVPELTVSYTSAKSGVAYTNSSPFLNFNGVGLAGSYPAISDVMYERIPQQIMGLLSLSHIPRFVIYSYGQSLKPADQSIRTRNDAYFGLCTNYQVTAETATRAVVRVEGAPSKPRIVVEQFNILPPE